MIAFFKFLTRISFLYLSFFWTTFEYCSLQTGGLLLKSQELEEKRMVRPIWRESGFRVELTCES